MKSWSMKNMRLLLRLLHYFVPFKKHIALGFLFLLSGLFLSLIQPVISMAIIDEALLKKNVKLLNVLGVAFLVVAVLSYLLGMARQYVFAVIQQKAMLLMRRDLTGHILKLPLRFHNCQNPGYLLSRVDADIGNLAGVMTDRYVQTFVDLLTLIGAALILILLNWKLALLSLAVLPFFTYSVIYFGEKMRTLSWENQERHALVAARLQDLFHSIFIIKVFAREAGELRLLMKSLIKFVRSNLQITRLSLLSNLVMGCIATLAPLSVIWYGGYLVVHDQLSIGKLFAFNMYLAHLFNPLRNIYGIVQSIQASLASLDRIFELFDLPGEESSPSPLRRIVKQEELSGLIEFEDVTFAYRPDQEVLKGISFRVDPHTTVALVGPSGAGKTTIFNLILRLYNTYRGRILIDGIDTRNIDLKTLRTLIRMVPQEPFLFNRSLKDNVRFGSPGASDEEIIRSCTQAHVDQFIKHLPDGYESHIGRQGALLSGGEKQRISIARALVSNPKILLLDEATSFLDSNTEKLVQEAIRDSMKGRTCLVIAHRLSTVLNADKIIVLDQGKIVDQGTHTELYSRCSLYAELCDQQFHPRPAAPSMSLEMAYEEQGTIDSRDRPHR